MQATYNVNKASKKIQAWQKESRLLGKEIARKAGVSSAHYTNIKKGKMRGSIEVLSKICRVLGHDIGELLQEDQKPKLPKTDLKRQLRPILKNQTNDAIEFFEIWLNAPKALRRALLAFHQAQR